MKANYENSFCMEHNCINYFEDSCMIALEKKETEIEPYTDSGRDSEDCKEFKEGTCIEYIIELEEEDINE